MENTKLGQVSLTLSTEEKIEWLAYYNLKKERLQRELADVIRNIAELKGETNSTDQYQLPLAYNKNWNWPQKFEFVLDQNRRPITTQVLISELASLERQSLSNQFKNRVNVAIQYQVKSGSLLTKLQIEGKIYIGLKKWATPEHDDPFLSTGTGK